MASKSFIFINILLIMTISSPVLTMGGFARSGSREVPRETVTELVFYFHDVHNDPGATSVAIVSSPLNDSSTNFGALTMIDNPLTEGPNMSTTVVGRAQGLYGSASLDYDGLLMVMNLVFIEGDYNGSSLAVVGRNKVEDTTRELPVVGGTGVFRLARGYALVSTYEFNSTAGGIIAEFNVTVVHYDDDSSFLAYK